MQSQVEPFCNRTNVENTIEIKKPKTIKPMRTRSVIRPLTSQPSFKPATKTDVTDWGMLETEKQIFGDRCPKGFTKLGILGKGGIAVVWLCQDCQGTKVAVKQFPKQKAQKGLDHSARVEMQVSEILFHNNVHKGLNSIAKLLQTIEEPKDTWLVFEVGASPFSKHLFDVKGEFFHGERVYNVKHKSVY